MLEVLHNHPWKEAISIGMEAFHQNVKLCLEWNQPAWEMEPLRLSGASLCNRAHPLEGSRQPVLWSSLRPLFEMLWGQMKQPVVWNEVASTSCAMQ
jgi:hypothetical protein